MAKSKPRGQRSRNVFHIASQKHSKTESKAKPVTTNLKKINILNDEKQCHENEPADVDEATRLMAQFNTSKRPIN
uniref:Ribosomal biogenesis factor n=1 Tax=Suricata suricatta TaxID=37032 RepID=A0A673SSW0_SURSU